MHDRGPSRPRQTRGEARQQRVQEAGPLRIPGRTFQQQMPQRLTAILVTTRTNMSVHTINQTSTGSLVGGHQATRASRHQTRQACIRGYTAHTITVAQVKRNVSSGFMEVNSSRHQQNDRWPPPHEQEEEEEEFNAFLTTVGIVEKREYKRRKNALVHALLGHIARQCGAPVNIRIPTKKTQCTLLQLALITSCTRKKKTVHNTQVTEGSHTPRRFGSGEGTMPKTSCVSTIIYVSIRYR